MSFDPYRGQEKDMVNVPVSLTSVAFILVTARLVTTNKTRGWYGAEDYFIVAAFVSSYPYQQADRIMLIETRLALLFSALF
jgi:hypothetical protein